MLPGFRLNANAEREWLRLQQHFELSDYFILGFIFSDNGAANSLLHDRLAAMYRAQISGLQLPQVESPQALSEEILPLLVRRNLQQETLRTPIWLDLSALEPTPAWRRARLDLLARLNERREQMRKHLTVPLVLVLPIAEKRQIRELVPDLWAIRNFAVDVDDWLEPLPALEPLPKTDTAISAPSELTPALVREWQRVSKRGSTEHGVLLAAGRATDALLSEGDYDQARAIAEEALKISRSRAQSPEDTHLALQDLSVALIKLGDAASAQGQLQYAQELYRESLDVRRKLLRPLDEDAETLRELAVALEKVGNVASAQSQWQSAQEYYSECLELNQSVLQHLGETPDRLHDLSVSLDNLGNVMQAQGQWQRAQELHDESLDLRRKFLGHLGESTETLHKLAVSLVQVGNVARTRGQWQHAQELYIESLDIRRKLLERLGETPETLGCLAASLEGVGSMAQAQGQQRTQELWSEGLAVAQELADRFPDTGDHQKLIEDFKQRLAQL